MVNALTRLVPVNAIYFKGDWAVKFDPNATTEDIGDIESFTARLGSVCFIMRDAEDVYVVEDNVD